MLYDVLFANQTPIPKYKHQRPTVFILLPYTHSSNFAHEIKNWGSGRSLPDDDNSNGTHCHDPHSSFGHCNAQFLSVVFEVSYSQKRNDVSLLAHDYIRASDGSMKAVIGFDIEYQKKTRPGKRRRDT